MQLPESTETLKELLFNTDKVETVIRNAFTSDLNIDEICDYITSKLFRQSIQRIYSTLGLTSIKISKTRLLNMDDGFIRLLPKLLKLNFLVYGKNRNDEAILRQFKEIDEEMATFLVKNTTLKVGKGESAFGVVYKNMLDMMLRDNSNNPFLSDTRIKEYERAISDLTTTLFKMKGFLQLYNSVYMPLVHSQIIVFNSSKLVSTAKLISEGYSKFTQKKFDNLCASYKYLAEYYGKHAKLLYALIRISKGRNIPEINELKRKSVGKISRMISQEDGYTMFSLKDTQIRNAIAHETALYDGTRRRCIFDDHDHQVEPLIITPEKLMGELKELFAMCISIARVANLEAIFSFLILRARFESTFPKH